MQLFIVDRKKLGVIFIVMGLMMLIFCVGARLDDKIRATAFLQNNLGELKDYSIGEYKVVYKLPERWSSNIARSSSGKIMYSNNFKSTVDGIWGSIEVFSHKEQLKEFVNINESEIKKYKSEPLDINGSEAYEVQYDVNFSGGSYHAYEYIIDFHKEFIKIKFYINSSKANINNSSIFRAITETVKKQ